MADFTIKQFDLLPVASFTATNSKKQTLTYASFGGATVVFRLVTEPNGITVVNATASIVLDADGVSADFVYTWSGTDTAVPGTYLGEFIVTFPSTKTQRFPNPGFLSILIDPSA